MNDSIGNTRDTTTTPAGAPPPLRRLASAGILGAAWTIAPAVLGFVLLAHIGAVSEWLATHGDGAIAVFVAGFALTAGLGVLPTYAQAVVAGWVFGLGRGLGAALAGFTLAALVGYVVVKLVIGGRLLAWIREHPEARVVRDALLARGQARTLGTVTLIRLPPNSPFALSNLALAGCGVAFLPYALGTVLGMTPRTAVVVAFAATAASTGASDIQQFVKEGLGPWVFAAGVAVMIVVLAVLGRIARRALRNAAGGAS